MIRTFHNRRLKFSRDWPEPIVVRHLWEDEPGTTETWDRHTEILAQEYGISVILAHAMLSLSFAEIYPK